jgi:hypothetical protein
MALGGTPLVDHPTSRHAEQPGLGDLVAAPVGEEPRRVRERLGGSLFGADDRPGPGEAEAVDPIEPVVEERVETAREHGSAAERVGRRHLVLEAFHDHVDVTRPSDLLPGQGFRAILVRGATDMEGW